MDKLTDLLELIRKKETMSADEIIQCLVEAVHKGNSEEYEKLYKKLYSESFGETLQPEIITAWVHSMAVTDGSDRTDGQKWSVDTTTEQGNKIDVDWDKCTKYEFYAAMNMAYSDNYAVAKAFGLQDDPGYFARMAKAFLCDTDAQPDKLFKYYFNVVA